MNKVITVTIPSYNVEQFLEDTLQSFVDARILADIEVLVVDDGSKDRTAEIGQMFADKYPETFRVISKENGGHGSTINRGIQEGVGKYFKVVDGDDWVDTEAFVQLVQVLKECEADYVVNDYYKVDDVTGEEEIASFAMLTSEEPWTFEEVAQKTQIAMHALTIKMSILKEHDIHLDEHSFYVDVEYILYPIPYVHTVQYYPLCIYKYRLAQVTQSVSIQGYQKHIQNHMDVILHLSAFFETYAKQGEPAKVTYIGKRIAQMVGDQATIFISYGAKDTAAKAKFIQFDKNLYTVSPRIHELSKAESGTLRLLRKTRFCGYSWIVKICMKRNNMEG